MYESIGHVAQLISQPKELAGVSHLILPGVGHFGHAASELKRSGWDEAIRDFSARSSSRILGLCLGAQLLGVWSEEGDCGGLGLLPLETVRLRSDFPVPNMGWRSVNYTDAFIELNPIFNRERYYFSHGYEMKSLQPDGVVGIFEYGGPRVAVVRHSHIIACQFHPEKSHRFGKVLLDWFASL